MPSIRLLTAVVAVALVACGSGSAKESAAKTAGSPSPDPAVLAYVALAKTTHDNYVAARGNAYNYCVVHVDPPNCHGRGVAMIAVWQGFLSDLDSLPAAPQFTTDRSTIDAQLPKAINDLKDMVAAAQKGDSATVLAAANAYISDMVPTVTQALGDMYEPWRNE